MISAEYLAEITRAVRVKQTATSDEELTGLIETALRDLSRQGAVLINPTDPLVKQAVKFYCKAHYGYDQQPAFREAYDNLSAGIALDYEYKDGDAV